MPHTWKGKLWSLELSDGELDPYRMGRFPEVLVLEASVGRIGSLPCLKSQTHPSPLDDGFKGDFSGVTTSANPSKAAEHPHHANQAGSHPTHDLTFII